MTRRSVGDRLDRAEILQGIWIKNSLRREARLPLWPVRETFEREVRQAQWRAHVEVHYDAIRARVLDEFRERHGEKFGLSAGGRWQIAAVTSYMLRTSFVVP